MRYPIYVVILVSAALFIAAVAGKQHWSSPVNVPSAPNYSLGNFDHDPAYGLQDHGR